jgi:pimeloyl-ACP methyl ester carboxylesterase
MRIPLFLLIVLQSTISYSQEKLVSSNGHQFACYLKGFEKRNKTTPAIVFENGMGMGYGTWDTVIDKLSKSAPVFAYNRLGVETSEKVFQMPTVKLVADNLKTLLSSLNIAPPYIIVGHSMGGLYARGFAGLYPSDVAGLVLIDPADFTESKDDWNSIFRAIGVPEKRIEEMIYERLYKKSAIDSIHFGPWSESQILTELRRTDFAELKTLPLPNAPIHFLVAGKFEVPVDRRSKDFNHEEFFIVKTNRNMQRWRKVIDASPKGGVLIYLTNCGHYIHRDDPNAVISSINNLLMIAGKASR